MEKERYNIYISAVYLHSIFICSFNTFHRISYCMYIMEQLSAMFPGHEIQLMYDVACVLVKHIQVCF